MLLLRASRSSELLTKEGILMKAMGSLAGKAISKVGIGKTLMGAAGVAATGAVAAPMISQGLQKSRVGLSPQYTQAQKYGLVGPMRA